MSMRDMVAPESCGVVNPMANMGNVAAQNAQMGADARSYANQQGKVFPGMGGPMQADMLRQGPGVEMPDFEAKFGGHGQMSGMHFQPDVGPMMQRPMGMDPNAMAAEFSRMNMQQQQVNPAAMAQQAEFEALYRQGGAAPNMGQQWAKDFNPQQMNAMQQNQWAAEFAQRDMQARTMNAPMNQMNAGGRMGMGMGMNPMMMGGMNMGGMMMNQPIMPQMNMMQQQQAMPVTQEPVETVAPAEVKTEEPVAAEPESMGGMGMGMDKEMIDKLMKSDDPKWRNSKFLKFIDKINKGEIEFKDNQAIEKQPEPVQMTETQAVGDEWAAQFDTETAETEWGKEFENMGSEQWLEQYHKDFMDFGAMQAMEQKDPAYAFAENNPYIEQEDPYALGLRLFKEGKLKAAILAFEAATKQNPDNAEAWRHLGSACAENEDEKGAISALLRCIAIDPYNLPALLMLGVSYTNDLEESRALNYLKTWMLHNPEYQGSTAITKAAEGIKEYEEFYGGGAGQSLDGSLHDQVTQMFLEASKVNPNDPDVYTVLGVLWHISSDFNKAIDAFKTAVKLKPDDPALWNKLGATQANSMKSADAVHAYKRALELRPFYVRALANLAISFANQGLHEDAARTYLATLKQNPNADHVWSYLRISLSNLEKRELVDLTSKRDVELFRPHFQF